MSMTVDQIREAIDERLTREWNQRCWEEKAAPIAVIAIRQQPGPGYGQTVLCSLEDLPDAQLADLLLGISRMLRDGRGGRRGKRYELLF